MKKTLDEFKEQLKNIQPKLDVLTEYVNSDTKIIVSDDLGIKYSCIPHKLLQNKKPSIISAIDKNTAFEIKANAIHKNKYIYEKINYINSNNKVLIHCKIHGDFLITPAHHLQGKGCNQCGINKRSEKKRKTTDKFIKEAIKVHGNKYNYTNTIYLLDNKKVDIECLKHGFFSQVASNHLQGQGCPLCRNETLSNIAKNNSYGWALSRWMEKCKNKFPKFYILKCYNQDEEFIKIGITSNDIKKRYPGKYQMPYNFKVIYEKINNIEYVYKLEKFIKKNMKNNIYKTKLNFNGMHECYEKKSLDIIIKFIDDFSL
jgi:hypothetical protein